MPDAKTSFDINFEKQILDTACVLRGNSDASEYRNAVLGLSFLKYISEGIFFIFLAAHWSEIAKLCTHRRLAWSQTTPCAASGASTIV